MVKYSGYGENARKIKALNCVVMLAVVTVIGTVLYFGYKLVQPFTSQAAMSSNEEEETARIMMSVTANSGLNVRTKPSTEGDIVLVLKNGEKVEVLSPPSDQWVYIRCIERNGEEGYASSKYLIPAEGNDIGAELDVGTFTDNLNSEKLEDTKEDAKYKGEQGGIEDWIKKHGVKLAIAVIIMLLLVSLAILISNRSSCGSIIFGGALLIVGVFVLWVGRTGVWSGLIGHLPFTQNQMTVGGFCLIALFVLLVLLLRADAEIPKLVSSLHSTAFYGLLIIAMFPDGASWGRLREFLGNISFVRSCVEFCWGWFLIFSVLTVGALPILLVIVLCGILCGLPYCFGVNWDDLFGGNRAGDIFDHAKNMVVVLGVTGFVFYLTMISSYSFSDVLCIIGLYFFIASWMISQYNIFAPAPFGLKLLKEEERSSWKPSDKYIEGVCYLSESQPTSLSYFDGTSPTLTNRDHDDLDMLQDMMDQHFSDGM